MTDTWTVTQYANRITALAAVQSPTIGNDILNPEVKTFLHARARHWQTSSSSPNPSQCNALPPCYTSQVQSRAPRHKVPVDWLEKEQTGIGHRASTQCGHGPEVKAAITIPTKMSPNDEFTDFIPICPTFGGGDTLTGECVFTQHVVQQAILTFFEDVAQSRPMKNKADESC